MLKMPNETQKTIDDWANNTFGYIDINTSIDRMLQEVEELKLATPEQVEEECADILITLYRVASAIGYDLHACVDHKMQINRGRKWKSNGDGTGQHIKE